MSVYNYVYLCVCRSVCLSVCKCVYLFVCECVGLCLSCPAKFLSCPAKFNFNIESFIEMKTCYYWEKKPKSVPLFLRT